jgi:hypothetical protein
VFKELIRMTKSNLVRESVIKGYLKGKSYDEIAYENNISKGSVSNIIKLWRYKMDIPDIDEIREFSVMLRKSGISINQCAQSFRFIQILANFGITDEPDSRYVTDTPKDTQDKKVELLIEKNGERRKDYSLTSIDNFYFFIDSIYNNCQKHGIESTNIIKWMHDLLEFDPLSHTANSKDVSSGFEEKFNEPIEFQKSETVKKSIYRKSQIIPNDREIQIPFISKISEYIEQEKSKIQNLDFQLKKLLQNIKYLEEQKNDLNSRILKLKRKESSSLIYLDWYKTIRQELFDLYNIKLEEEVGSFVNLFNDFKYHNYNPLQIIKEYRQIKSIRDENESIQSAINSSKETRDHLLREIESLRERESYSRQSLETLLELSYAGFGFKEIKHLKNTVVEIAVANDISWMNAGTKLIKDIEGQYDDKLGFETKINEIRMELKKLEDEVPGYKECLQSQLNAFGRLQYLYGYGVTNDDIINMSDVVIAYQNGSITFNPILQSESIVDENGLLRKPYYWKLFINEIKNLGNINSQIIKQSSVLDTIKKEIDELDSQRLKINEQALLSSQILNSLSGRFMYFVETLRQIMAIAQQLNKIFIMYQSHLLICVIVNGNSQNGNGDIDKQEDEEKTDKKC